MRLRAMLFCIDVTHLSAFYAGLLGLTVKSRSPEYVDFGDFALHAIPAEIIQSMSLRPSSTPRETGSTKLIFEVPDPSAMRAKLESGGHQILDRPWGGWDAVDPEGNVFQIAKTTSETS